jgi:predicted transcriptional regulator
MSLQQYREFWKLAPDYPMMAPNYPKSRSVARSMGLGQKAAGRERSAKRGKKAA